MTICDNPHRPHLGPPRASSLADASSSLSGSRNFSTQHNSHAGRRIVASPSDVRRQLLSPATAPDRCHTCARTESDRRGSSPASAREDQPHEQVHAPARSRRSSCHEASRPSRCLRAGRPKASNLTSLVPRPRPFLSTSLPPSAPDGIPGRGWGSDPSALDYRDLRRRTIGTTSLKARFP